MEAMTWLIDSLVVAAAVPHAGLASSREATDAYGTPRSNQIAVEFAVHPTGPS
jgi:hypothetical protein